MSIPPPLMIISRNRRLATPASLAQKKAAQPGRFLKNISTIVIGGAEQMRVPASMPHQGCWALLGLTLLEVRAFR